MVTYPVFNTDLEKNPVKRLARPEEREEVAGQVDPGKALVFFVYAETDDPYGDHDDLSQEAHQVGREWFAVDPEVGIAVDFDDLPHETREALEEKYASAKRRGWQMIAEMLPDPPARRTWWEHACSGDGAAARACERGLPLRILRCFICGEPQRPEYPREA